MMTLLGEEGGAILNHILLPDSSASTFTLSSLFTPAKLTAVSSLLSCTLPSPGTLIPQALALQFLLIIQSKAQWHP